MNANPQSDHPPHTCSSAPQLYIKNKSKKQTDHPLRHVLQAPKNKFPEPKNPHFSKKADDRKSGSKTVPPLYSFNRNGLKNDYFCSLSGHIRTEIQVSKNGTPWATKTGLGHQKRTDFTYQTQIQPRLRRCGDETKGFGMHLKRNTDMTHEDISHMNEIGSKHLR
jgi:hypothetical protein